MKGRIFLDSTDFHWLMTTIQKGVNAESLSVLLH
jgi:hypothetical protein